MEKNVVTKTMFGLRNKLTGQLAELSQQENESQSCSGQYSYTIHDVDRWSTLPPFEVDSAEKAALVLVLNTPWYNSTAQRPRGGNLDIADYEVVQVVRIVEVTPVSVDGPVIFANAVEYLRKPRCIAERYLGVSLDGEVPNDEFEMLVLAIPKGESLASLRVKCLDRVVLIGEDFRVAHSMGAFELPDEYADLAKASAAVGLSLTRERR